MAKISKSTIKVVNTETGKTYTHITTVTPKAGSLDNSFFGTLAGLGITKLQSKENEQNILNAMGTMYNYIKTNGMPALYDEKDWCGLLRGTFGLNEEELGTRGEKWSSPEERTAHKVYINDIEFNPEFTPGQLKRIQVTQVEEQKTEESIETPAVAVADITPVIPQIPTPQMPTPQAQGDKSEISLSVVPQAPTPQMPTPAIQAPQVTTKDNTSAVDLAHIEKLKFFIATGKYSKAILISSLAKQTNKEKAEQLYKLAVTEAIPLF